MLQLRPKKNIDPADEQIRAELNWMLQNSEGWFIRIVYGFVKRMYKELDTADEMEVAA